MFSCSKKAKETAADTNTASNTAKSGACFFEDGENGFYFATALEEEYLFFYDEAAQSAVKTCGKANCRHDSNDCNSRFGTGSSNMINMYNLQYDHGKIYLWSSSTMEGPHLYSADPDGTNHEDLGALKIDMTRGQSGVYASFILNDMVYVIATVGTNQLGYQYQRFYKRSIQPGADTVLLFADEDEKTVEHRMDALVVCDGMVYFVDDAFLDGTNRFESKLYRYDPAKDELQNILTLENKRINYTVKDQKVYYSAFNYEGQLCYEDFCCYDPETKESQSFYPAGGHITWDGQHFVLSQFEYDAELSEKYNKDELSVTAVLFISENGELIREIPAEQLAEDLSEANICMSEEYIVTDAYIFKDNQFAEEIRIFKKDDVLDGKLEYQTITFTDKF